MSSSSTRPRLGIALGGGAARGWAHIGVLSALARSGIEPEIVCGTSIGALVGGIYAAGKLGQLETWVASLTRRDVVSLLDFTTAGGGAIGGRKLMELYRRELGDPAIEELPKAFAAVATDLRTGSEVWLLEGSLLEAIRASISLPGVFTPVLARGRWLVDGGLVNPVPVSLCRALGAEIVIAVDLHGGALRPNHGASKPGHEAQPAVVRDRSWWQRLAGRSHEPEPESEEETPHLSVASVIATSLDIMQARLSRSRLAGDPPDLLLSPSVRTVPTLDFAGGQATIEEGYDVVRRMMPALADVLGVDAAQPPGGGLPELYDPSHYPTTR